MDDTKKCEEELLGDVYKNAHIALQSISDVMSSMEEKDTPMKAELKEEYEAYEKFMSDLSAYLKDKNMEREDINALKKALMWSSIKLNTLKDDSDSHVADMMVQGTVMGITDLRAMLNDDTTLSEESKAFVKELLAMEEKFEARLKKFL